MQGPHSAVLGDSNWPAAGRPVDYAPLKVGNLLRQTGQGEEPWYWALNPYEGCEFACTFCHARLDRKDTASWLKFERSVGVKANAVELLVREMRAEDFRGRQVVLGTSTEPWQQAEENFRLTRALLAELAKAEELDLRINTRSSLIARDGDLLKEIAAKGRVTIAFSLASLDERVNRLLEPRAPSAFRRLAALEALARTGLNVGLLVSPVMPGLSEEELSLEPLLTRAANAGARFAGMREMELLPGQRELFFQHVTAAYPSLAVRFRRVVGVKAPAAEEQARRAARFEDLCERLGLLPLHRAVPPRTRAVDHDLPAQLPLF